MVYFSVNLTNLRQPPFFISVLITLFAFSTADATDKNPLGIVWMIEPGNLKKKRDIFIDEFLIIQIYNSINQRSSLCLSFLFPPNICYSQQNNLS